MRRTAFVIVLIVGIALTGATQSNGESSGGDSDTPRFSIEAGGGLYYNAVELPDNDLGAFFTVLFSLRGGGYIDGIYHFNSTTGAGLELGFQYSQVSSDNVEYTLFDIPVRAVADFEVLPWLSLRPYGGFLFQGASLSDDSGTESNVNTRYEIGNDIHIGNDGALFIETGYAFGSDQSFPRFGIGYHLSFHGFGSTSSSESSE